MDGSSTEKLNNKKNLLAFIISLAVAAFSLNLALITDPMIFLLFYVLAAVASSWLASAKGTVLALLSAFIGWGAAFMLTEDPFYAILSVSYVPFSIALPQIAKGKLSRSGAVGFGTACVTLGTVTALLSVTYFRIGSVSLSAIRAAFPYFFEQVSELLYESFYIDIAGSKVSIIAESNVVEYLNLIICLLPAAFSAVITLIGFVIAWLYKKFAEKTSVAEVDRQKWTLLPSPITALFFLLALITALIFDTVSIVSLTALNMLIIILPIIFLTGLLTSMSPKITNGIPRPRLLRPLTLIISVFNGVVPFTLLCTVYGIFDSIKSAFSRRKPKNQE